MLTYDNFRETYTVIAMSYTQGQGWPVYNKSLIEILTYIEKEHPGIRVGIITATKKTNSGDAEIWICKHNDTKELYAFIVND